MAETTVFLIRHGDLENPKNIIYDGSISLSDFGREKMRALGRILRDRGARPDAVVSSDFLRALQSSEEILNSYSDLRLSIELDPRLRDTYAPELCGRSLAWLAEIGDPYTHPELNNIHIEKPCDFTKRMIEVVMDAVKRYYGKTIFMVSHGDPTAFVMWQLLNLDKPLPTLTELKKDVSRVVYLEKGEAWRILFDEHNNVLEHEHIVN